MHTIWWVENIWMDTGVSQLCYRVYAC